VSETKSDAAAPASGAKPDAAAPVENSTDKGASQESQPNAVNNGQLPHCAVKCT
jgi:hypothetical protein